MSRRRVRDEGPGLFGPEPEPAPPRARSAPRRRSGAKPRVDARHAVPDAALFVETVLNKPMRRRYTYAVPPALEERVAIGARVAVPFGTRREVAVVVAVARETDVPPERLRGILDVLDPQPIVSEELLELTRWIGEEYACAWGEALHAALPAALKRERSRRTVAMVEAVPGVDATALEELANHSQQERLLRTLLEASGPLRRVELLRRLNLSESPLKTLVKKGLARVLHVEVLADELLEGAAADRERPEQLTDDQTSSVARIEEALERREHAPFLLYGVTGSGKTEVYLRAIEAALAQGRGAIVLVPEISLTPQTVGWFRARFGTVAVLHSQMTDAQRHDMWRALRTGEARVVVGARSAVFAPIDDLGVIVVDEEHEPSFKQGSAPRYHAREVALRRARQAGAVCILGSATPALESWVAAERGELGLLRLGARPGARPMPTVEVVDVRRERSESGLPHLISRRLSTLLIDAVSAGEQAILFINRRGFAPSLWCAHCDSTVKCKNCDVALTWHKRLGRMVCHSCCEETELPKKCELCSTPALRFMGAGSQRVEEVLSAVVPHARVGRMDSDTMLRREDYEETLSAFGRGDLDVLVGTQMIAKGLDFPKVTVVGIVSADSSLHMADFRASERTFQLISQVAGRAGRGALEGRIVIQARDPMNVAIQTAAKHDYERFVAHELEGRRTHGQVPFVRVVRVVCDDEDEDKAFGLAAKAAECVRTTALPLGGQLLGPSAAPMYQLRGRYRFHVEYRAPLQSEAFDVARRALADLAGGRHGNTRISVDVDPVSMM